jgi:hypothetical protein
LWQLLRSIVLESEASAEHDAFAAAFPRFDEQWRGAEWFLARTPEVGVSKQHEGIPIYLLVRRGDPLANTPDLAVIYTFDEKEVVVHAIKATQPIAQE